MKQPTTDLSGNLTINLSDTSNDWKVLSVTVADCSVQDFFSAAENLAKTKSRQFSRQVPNWNKVAGVFLNSDQTTAKEPLETELNTLHSVQVDTSYESQGEKVAEDFMSDFTKSELQAHLNANKAEVNAVASSMKKDMAEWREQMRSDMRDVTDAITKQNSNLEKHFHAQDVRLVSSLELQSSKFENALTNAKLDIIKWALGLPALAFAVYKIYGLITHTPTP